MSVEETLVEMEVSPLPPSKLSEIQIVVPNLNQKETFRAAIKIENQELFHMKLALQDLKNALDSTSSK